MVATAEQIKNELLPRMKKYVEQNALSIDSDTQIAFANLFTDTFVQKVSGKGLSTNDFTNAYKEKLEGLSSVTSGGMSFYIGATAPTDGNTIWFDTSGY